MKVLWFTNSPSNASLEFGSNAFGGGWYSSLETLVAESNTYELAVCFFYNGSTFKKLVKGRVVYYGVPFKKSGVFKRILDRHQAKLIDEEFFFFEQILSDFKPDLIHVFGTEMGYGKMLMHRPEKVLFNLQGLVSPIADVFFPPGVSKFQLQRISDLSSFFRGVTPYHHYKIFKRMAIREKATMRFWKYFIGRTEWDRNYVALMNSKAQYFHCDEMLRKEFFSSQWVQPSEVNANTGVRIGTTINASSYKGLDLVYKVMKLIKNYNIEWHIFGIHQSDMLNKIVNKSLKIKGVRANIKFHGQIHPEELIAHLKTCHFFVHPSYIDNSPNSVCEAMVLGMPVLSSSVGGIKTLIKNLETGFLFNPYDQYDLAGLVVHLINNYEEAIKVGVNARLVALKRHSPSTIMSDLHNIYRSIYNGELNAIDSYNR